MPNPKQLFKNTGFWVTMTAILITVFLAWHFKFKPKFPLAIHPFLQVMGGFWFIGVPLWFCAKWGCSAQPERTQRKISNIRRGLLVTSGSPQRR